MTTQLELSIDESVLLSQKEDRETFGKTLMRQAAISLYRTRRLSLGKAAPLAGLDRMRLVGLLQDEGIPIFDYEDELVDSQVAQGEEALLKLKARRSSAT